VQSAISVQGNPQAEDSSLPRRDRRHPRTENEGQPAKREQSASLGTGRTNLQGMLRGRGQAEKGGKTDSFALQ
jgi:hypothetical protein